MAATNAETYRRGTLQFSAPETLRNEYGLASDVWSFAMVMYEVLSGTPPFAGLAEPAIYDILSLSKPFRFDPGDLDSDDDDDVEALDLRRRRILDRKRKAQARSPFRE